VSADQRGARLAAIVATFAFASFIAACLSVLATAAIPGPRPSQGGRGGVLEGSQKQITIYLITYIFRDEFSWSPSDQWWIVYQNYTEWPAPDWTLPGSLGPERVAELPKAGFQVRAGWPFRAFIGEPGQRLSNGQSVPGARHSAIIGPFSIPTKPLWGGLLANLAIHTAAWFVVLPILRFVVFSITVWPFRTVRRRIVRHRRKDNGLCLNCGYDVYDQPSGSKCPECGEARW
jgi:hypothetical protein